MNTDELEVGDEAEFTTRKKTFAARVESVRRSIILEPIREYEVEEYEIIGGEVWELRYPTPNEESDEGTERKLGTIQEIRKYE